MSHVLTLIAAGGGRIDAALADAVRALLPDAGAPVWLSAGQAVDIGFGPPDAAPANAESAVRGLVAAEPIDVVVQPAAGRRKRLLVADMDSTMIGQECIDELADIAGLRPRIAAITERAMRGEVAFEPALRERVALLKGLPVTVIAELLESRITLTRGAIELVRTMKANGARTVLVSGGFTAFTEVVAARIGFDEHHANRLLTEGGRLAGTVAEPILGREAKLATLQRVSAALGLDAAESLAIGDGANDLAMIQAAGLGVAYHAKPVVAAAAPARIDRADLTGVLFLQGYRREEFVR